MCGLRAEAPEWIPWCGTNDAKRDEVLCENATHASPSLQALAFLRLLIDHGRFGRAADVAAYGTYQLPYVDGDKKPQEECENLQLHSAGVVGNEAAR